MISTIILILSIILQFTAAELAIKLILVTRKRMPWLYIATAVVLMGIRHSIKLGRIISEDFSHPPDLSGEFVALIISILMVVGIARIDSMFRKMKENASKISESEKRYLKLYESMMDAFVATDMKGNIIEFNQQYLNMLGYNEEEIGKLTRMDLTPKKWHNMEFEIIEKQLIKEGYSDVYEKEYIKKDGTVFPVELRTFLITNVNGIAQGKWSIVRDITERKCAEEELKKYQGHLEELVKERTKELESFTYSVSHDLRAPLRAIDGFSQVLLEEQSKKLDKEGKRLLNVIIDNTRNMGQLIDDLLSFSRLGRKSMSYSSINMEKLVNKVFNELKPSSSKRKVELQADSLPSLIGDYKMLQQVFYNLLANAIKFTKTKQKTVIEVGGVTENNENIYYVKDNGVGFDMKYSDKLFNVFQRLHSQQDYPGTGVGLAIAKRIINRHKGRIWSEGKVGKGAVFYFAIPKEKQKSEERTVKSEI
jgi:PAS domain S-box-containing protein